MKKISKKLIVLIVGLVMIMSTIPAMAITPASSEDGKGLSGATVTQTKTYGTYNGSEQDALFKVVIDGKTLVRGKDYVVANNVTDEAKAGYYNGMAVIYGINSYNGMCTKTWDYTIKQASKAIKVSTSTKTVYYSKAKKATQYTSAVSVSNKMDRTVTMKKLSGSSKITVSGTKFKVKKGTKKGTYKIKVRVYAKGGTNYASTYKTVYITVKVK